MAGRGSERTKHRSPCTLNVGGRRHSGLVLDFSQSGLFIQTSAKPEPGERLDIELVMRGESLRMQVEVARRKQVPPQLLTVAHGGLGVRILSAPERFYQLLAQAQGTMPTSSRPPSAGSTSGTPSTRAARPAERPPRPVPGPTPGPGISPGEASGERRFAVRVKQVSGSRTRTLRIHADDEAAARRAVADDLGEEWKILELSEG